MTTSKHELAQTITQFPVISGDTFHDSDNLPHTLDAAQIVMKSPDGIERTIVLTRRPDGQWWAPSINAD